MSTIVEFTVPTEGFALHRALAAAPETVVEAERLASHSSEWVMPFVWVTGGDLRAFDAALEDDPTVVGTNVVDDSGDAVLYQIEWNEDVEETINTIIDEHGNILEAGASEGEWRLKLRFADQQQLEIFQEVFAERDQSFEVERLVRETGPRQQKFDLTPEQRETLVTALEMGYFSVPRDVTVEELADVLDVSANSVSQRLRRAHSNLVESTLTLDGSEGNDDDGR